MRLYTDADIRAAFGRADRKTRNALAAGVTRLLAFTASKARSNVRMRMKRHRSVGAGSSLLQNIGKGPSGIRYIEKTPVVVMGGVGTKLEHGIYLEFGTGIYGPKRKRITSKTPGKPLFWVWPSGKYKMVKSTTATGKSGRRRQRLYNWQYAMSVKGVRPWRWLSNALKEMAPRALSVIAQAMKEAGI